MSTVTATLENSQSNKAFIVLSHSRCVRLGRGAQVFVRFIFRGVVHKKTSALNTLGPFLEGQRMEIVLVDPSISIHIFVKT